MVSAPHDQQHPVPELGTHDDVSPPRGCPFPIVGIGASAGGLEAFTQLLRALPPDTGMAFVFIQHLDPKQESHLAKILAPATPMPVHIVIDGMPVEPDNLYVVPPNVTMVLRNGALHLSPREPRMYLPIDVFFRSLATEQGACSIAVVLSGNASDGSQGLLAIKGECGVTFAQEESSARFGGMPHSALATGAVDFVLEPADIARQLAQLGNHRYVIPAPGKPDEEILPDGDGDLHRLFAMLVRARKVDFTHYKRTTVRRRIGRRMIVHNLGELSDYVALCQRNPRELDDLYRDLLIHVTSFFRDSETFTSLKSILTEQLTTDTEAVRVWVPGCATGEEVYSLAICLSELIHKLGLSPRLQVFGTDISDTALETARSGIYTPIIAQDVSAERLERFFREVDGGFQVSKAIRELCIFARQDLTKDPPFSRLSLVSCRNVLIYLDSVLQNKVIPIFHYSLNPGGLLLLGTAETIASFGELFDPVDNRNKIFARKFAPVRFTMDLSAPSVAEAAPYPRIVPPLTGKDLHKKVDRIVQDRYAPAGVVIDGDFHILQFRGHTSAYLDPSPGDASLNLLRMARPELTLVLRHALKEASGKNGTVSARARLHDTGAADRDIAIEITPISGAAPRERYFLVVFNDVPAAVSGQPLLEPLNLSTVELEQRVQTLQGELSELRDQVVALNEDHTAHLEELQAANEEVSSTNEELQSTNEELGTTKEELQSANEELTTLNEELHTRNQQLNVLNDDLSNLLGATNIPILIVNNDCRIRRLTSASEELLQLNSMDIGRPVGQTNQTFPDMRLEELVECCRKTLRIQEQISQNRNGRWYSITVRPYRTIDDRIVGALIAFIDVDPLQRTLKAAEQERDYAQSVIETVHEPLIVLDADLKVMRATDAFYTAFHVSREETEGRFLYNLGNGQWNLPRLRELLTEALFRDTSFQDFEIEQEFPYIGKRMMRLNGRRIPSIEDGKQTLLLAIEDLTERKQLTELLYGRMFETAKDGILVLDAETGVITDVNPHLLEMTGYAREHFIGKQFNGTAPFRGIEAIANLVQTTREQEVTRYDTITLSSRGAGELSVEIVANAYLVGSHKSIQCHVRDVTERVRVQTALRESELRFRLFVESVQDYALFQFSLDGKVITWNPGAERLLGYRENEIIGQPAALLFTPEDVDKGEHHKEMATARREGRVEDERWHIRKDGTRFWSSGVVTLVRDDAGKLRAFAKIMRDITERKKIEEELREAVKEKEILIKEIHHRVKNNLQVITSLLNLQSGHITDVKAKDTLEQTRIRVRAIATIHDLLYKSGSLARVDMEEHILTLAQDLYSVYGVQPERVRVTVEIHEVNLDIDQAMPCTLMINELMSNAFKYAFPDESPGEIAIVLERTGQTDYCLSLKDNGVGLPPDLDFRNTQSMGLQLINIFVDQLQGSAKVLPGPGTHWEIRFPAGS
ncbi:MAG: chemotaxis protein CheB [Bryobacteraceae bacterium]